MQLPEVRVPRSKEHRPEINNPPYQELRLLEEIESAPDSSQRLLASQVGVALGVINLLIRNMVKKGYVRATRVSWRRWVYILTPAGFARKVHLTLDYVDRFMSHYQRVRRLLKHEIGDMQLNQESRIAIYGTTELAELIYLALRDLRVTEIRVFNKGNVTGEFLGKPITQLNLIHPTDYSKVIVAFPNDIGPRRDELLKLGFPRDHIVTLFHDSRENLAESEGLGPQLEPVNKR